MNASKIFLFFLSMCTIENAMAITWTLTPNAIDDHDPCISQAEADQVISKNRSSAKIFDKHVLKKIMVSNKDALSKIQKIKQNRILVLPANKMGLKDECKGSIQVYFVNIIRK